MVADLAQPAKDCDGRCGRLTIAPVRFCCPACAPGEAVIHTKWCDNRQTHLRAPKVRPNAGEPTVARHYSKAKAKDYTDPRRHKTTARGGPIERRYVEPSK